MKMSWSFTHIATTGEINKNGTTMIIIGRPWKGVS